MDTMKDPVAESGGRAATAERASTHRSLERGLAVLESVAGSPGPVTLADTARRVGLHRSTAHHLLQTLVRTGYLAQDDVTRGYRLTAKLEQMCGRGVRPRQVVEAAQPVLERLTALTGEASSVAVWDQGKVRIVARRESDGSVGVVQDVLAERPLYCTAVGKVLAAWRSKAELGAALAGVRLEPHTSRTITDREALAVELRRVRHAGYAIDDEEHREGMRCIAMPVFDATGDVLASICLVGPKERMTHQRLMAIRAPLGTAGRELAEALGVQPR